MNAEMVLHHLPGKSGNNGEYLPLWMHLEDTAIVIEYLYDHRISDSVINACGMGREEFRKVCVFLAMIHDIGKATPLFVARISAGIPYRREILLNDELEIPPLTDYIYSSKSPHARAGEAVLSSYRVPEGICSIVGAHHGKPTDVADYNDDQIEFYPFNYFAKQKKLWDDLRSLLLRRALIRAGYNDVCELPALSNCAQMLLCGLLIQADWIASNQTYFPLLSEETEGDISYYPARNAYAFSNLLLPDGWKAPNVISDPERLFSMRFGFLPNPMQKCAAEISRSISSGGLLILEAQMGTGKTEAALASAEAMAFNTGCSGVFFGLPTQATSNGIFPRLTEWAEDLSRESRHSIRLVHGMAEQNGEYHRFFYGTSITDEDGNSGLIAHAWFSGKKQALLADFVVGTVDHALMAALSQKHVMLRHLGLCGKVVIIDEVHAYDAYMSWFLYQMLRWLGEYHVPVILLSATLPQNKKKEMISAYTGKKKLQIPETKGYPLITWTEEDAIRVKDVENLQEVQKIRIRKLDEMSIEADVRHHLRDGGCIGVIVNTVKRAQMLAERLRRDFPEEKVLLYHAQFISEDRVRREKELMAMIGKNSTTKERDHVIIVGTQVLEQSLDIDFDYLITDLCPMDLLLQRMGRLHRHKRVRPAALRDACCSVLCSEGELETGAKMIYEEWLLQQTAKHLPQEACFPQDIPKLVELVYSATPDPDDNYNEAWEHFQNHSKEEENKARRWLLRKPKTSRFPSRNTLVGMMQTPIENEKHAEASVRDTTPSVDVLVLWTVDDEHIGFAPWSCDMVLRRDTMPAEEEARKIARQRLHLPFAMCCGEQLDSIIAALEEENLETFPLWQESPWLKGELILLLDEKGEKDLCEYHINYEKDMGLQYAKRGD